MREIDSSSYPTSGSASLPASPGSPCGANRSTDPRFVIQVKVGRSSGSVGQLSEVEPTEESCLSNKLNENSTALQQLLG